MVEAANKILFYRNLRHVEPTTYTSGDVCKVGEVLQRGICDEDGSITEVILLHTTHPLNIKDTRELTSRITEIGGYLGGESAEDYDLWLRCLQENFRFSNMSETLTGYNQDPNKPARRSRKAYAGAASSLLRSAIVSGDFRFVIGCFLYCLKAIALTKKA